MNDFYKHFTPLQVDHFKSLELQQLTHGSTPEIAMSPEYLPSLFFLFSFPPQIRHTIH